VIELNATFWIVTAGAVLLLSLATSQGFRRPLQAAINVLFVTALLRERVVLVAIGILVAYLLLQAVGRARRTQATIVLGTTLLGLLALFLAHKLPHASESSRWAAITPVLAAIGYSYVALRAVDVFKAVYDRRVPPPDPPSLVNYLLPFHMLAAGPIQSYEEFWAHRNDVAPLSADRVLTAVERIARGLSKKFILAFVLQKLFLTDFEAGGLYRVWEAQVFFVWLYLDFSAYSDIAVGIGTLLGVVTPENFNRPLLARNTIQFWERWHMSLSLFVRRQVFIPMQMMLMRQTDATYPLACAIVATAVSFLVTGLWHGLTVGFLLWGLLQGAGVIATRLYSQMLQKRLGAKGVRAYLANPWIQAAAVAVTFEYQAAILITLFIR
jgi:D-alanyl-lipoteichoic acid acyltransferase DltB (MBOAT superfamily)